MKRITTLILFFNFVVASICAEKMNDMSLVKVSFQQVYIEQPNPELIKIFPNPATEIIGFIHDDKIAKVVFYNIIGKEVKSLNHTSGQKHSVIDLRKGIYILRLFDENNRVIKVTRVTVN